MIHTKRNSTVSSTSFTSLLFVLLVHAALLYGMWHHRLPSTNTQTVTLFAELIAPPQPKIEAPETPKANLKAEHIPPPPEKPKVVKKTQPQPKHRQLASNAPVLPKEEFVAPPSPRTPEPVHEEPAPTQKQQEAKAVAAARPEQMQSGPVTLTSELSVSCPELSAPDYPALSRRLGEEGKLMLQVELDESGRISNTRIVNSSGYSRLDNAALAAVKTWRCKPAVRDGQPVRAIALQPFNFVIQGN
ncbi:energy transducer TonB [Nitrosomonas sp. Nm33]|uniref:energy transducer TonB n=1 Tax=Nitrosomonas sp. Nm33 TaxID=133724 RepID=UPI000895DBBF|nr:energy transducer TonB [Nitrosomonas sp. Nm33]SDY84839.1 protein TonB [Nitrosomonas sp. Nm33]